MFRAIRARRRHTVKRREHNRTSQKEWVSVAPHYERFTQNVSPKPHITRRYYRPYSHHGHQSTIWQASGDRTCSFITAARLPLPQHTTPQCRRSMGLRGTKRTGGRAHFGHLYGPYGKPPNTTSTNPLKRYGDPGRSRTYDLRIRSPLLYPAELRGLETCVSALCCGRIYRRRPASSPPVGTVRRRCRRVRCARHRPRRRPWNRTPS